jgi:hypothetical protein
MLPVSRQWTGKHVLAAKNTHTTIVTVGNCFLRGPCKVIIKKTIGATQLVVSLEFNSAREAVKIGPKSGKLKDLHC